MPTGKRLGRALDESLDRFRLHLARPDALLSLALLGVVTGLAAGALTLLFRWLIEAIQAGFLPDGLAENYEGLAPLLRIFLPVGGGLAIGLLLMRFAKRRYGYGVVHVMERLAYHQGHLTLRGLMLQFLGAGLAIVSGHSVGREGPSIHLGAAAGSQIGTRLGLPNNAVRTLVGCGTAAAIAASFNTPLAGIIFALEVVMMEYTLLSFIPVILAAVTAAGLSTAAYGADPAFILPPMHLESLLELPLIVLLGIVTGTLAAGFIHAVQWIVPRGEAYPLWARLALAGLIVGLLAQAYPEVMGIGYDTVNAALFGQIGIAALIGITLAKAAATAASIGLGVPAGLIGPTLVMGATLGGVIGWVSMQGLPEISSGIGFYALLGMGAMMGATLQAPLAALTAMLELTGTPAIILPGMLAIVTAGITSRAAFGKHSIFMLLLQARGLDYRSDPVMQALRRVGVASAMERDITRLDRVIDRAQAEAALSQGPKWLLIETSPDTQSLLSAVALARYLQESPEASQIELLEIPGTRLQATGIFLEATLQQALDVLEETHAEAVFIRRPTAPGIYKIYGVLTREQIEAAYRY
jgi:H+/Cl- antiporter ClcA